MKALRTSALFVLLILAVRGEAGEVRWNVFELTMDGSIYYPPLDGQAAGYYGGDITPEIGFLYNRNQQGRITSITAARELMNCGANANTWALANYGDELITSADFLAKTSVFENTIAVPTKGTEFYLAFQGILLDYDEQIGMTELPYYGWVSLGITRTDGLYVNGSFQRPSSAAAPNWHKTTNHKLSSQKAAPHGAAFYFAKATLASQKSDNRSDLFLYF